jgi:guanylate kinase
MIKPLLIVISSPSGGGKTTICKMLINDPSSPIFGNSRFSISATTRKIRGNEVDGVDYHFLTKQQFEEKIAKEEFLEYANVYGNFYGTLLTEAKSEKHTLFDIDVKGNAQIKQKADALSIFLLPPSIETLKQRLKLRGDLTEEDLKNRLEEAKIEIARAGEYDFQIINENLDDTFIKVCEIIRLKIQSQKS